MPDEPDELPPVRFIFGPDRHPLEWPEHFLVGHLLLILLFLSYYLRDGVLKEARDLLLWAARRLRDRIRPR